MSSRALRIGINGLGRIGRQVLRLVVEQEGMELVHVNDLSPVEALTRLLCFDATHGPWNHRVEGDDDELRVDGRAITVTAMEEPARIPWHGSEVDVVLEAVGVPCERDEAAQHLEAGATKVLVVVPGRTPLDGEFVLGVNGDRYDPRRHHVISIGGSTTHCLAPLARLLHEALGIRHGFVTTVYAYTSAPELFDAPRPEPWGSRAEAELVPTATTTVLSTLARVIPALEGRLHGIAVQAPVKCGSLLDLTCTFERATDAAEVVALLRTGASGPLAGILAVEDGPVTARNVIGDEHSAVVGVHDVRVLGRSLLKLLAWFDSETAFSRRCVDMMARMLEPGAPARSRPAAGGPVESGWKTE